MNLYLLVFTAAFPLMFSGCGEELEPYGVYREKYILNTILRSDTPLQIATLEKSYNLKAFDPFSNKEDPAVSGAVIKVYYDKDVSIYHEDSVARSAPSQYDTPFRFYKTNDLLPKPRKTYDIVATLENGKILRASTTVPGNVSFKNLPTDRISRDNGNEVTIDWTTDRSDLYVAARFKVIYFNTADSVRTRHEKIVPAEYVLIDGQWKPHFPEPSYASFIHLSMGTLDRAMEEISGDDPIKSHYVIFSFLLEVMIYDENLTSYYASTTDVKEGYSIQLDVSDYSNIEGGLGVFGSFNKQITALKFDYAYIHSFGYTPGLTE